MPRRHSLVCHLLEEYSHHKEIKSHLIVTDYSKHCINIIDPTNAGKKIRSFGQLGYGQVHFQHPLGVAVTQDGCILVADASNNRLQVLTAEDAFIATVGTRGFQPLQFKYPIKLMLLFITMDTFLFPSRVTIMSRSSMLTSPTRTASVAKELNQESLTLHVV